MTDDRALGLRASAMDPRSAARAYGTAVNAEELRGAMRQRGLTGAELARRAAVSAATISHAVNGRRIHPAKLRAILDAMHRAEPLPGLDLLILRDDGPSGPRVSTMTMPNRGLPSPTRRRRSPD